MAEVHGSRSGMVAVEEDAPVATGRAFLWLESMLAWLWGNDAGAPVRQLACAKGVPASEYVWAYVRLHANVWAHTGATRQCDQPVQLARDELH